MMPLLEYEGLLKPHQRLDWNLAKPLLGQGVEGPTLSNAGRSGQRDSEGRKAERSGHYCDRYARQDWLASPGI